MLHIDELKKKEFSLFLNSSKLEGWDNDLVHIECLYNSYSKDFFIAYKDKTLIGFVLAIKESKELGSISNLLVLKRFRSLGYGKELLKFAIKHLRDRQIVIDSMLGRDKLYESFGFKSYYTTSTYLYISGTMYIENSHIQVSDISEKSILDYNKKINLLKTLSYQSCLFNSKYSLYKGVYKDEMITSYAIRFRYKSGYKIVFFADTIDEAITLFFSLLKDVEKSISIYIEISELQKTMLPLIKIFKMKQVDTTIKMYNKIV